MEKVPLKEGVREYLKELKERKIPMVIATSGDRKNAEAALKRLKFFLILKEFLSASEIGSGKNQRSVTFRSGTSTGYRSGADLGLEDAWHAIRTAKSAGLRRSQSMIRRTIKIWDKSGIMRIFICRIC